ncbi:MAG: two-component regulator propeller domain-containing protein [Verrucomicrobiota bacterium]
MTDDGLPQKIIIGIDQTSDGSLWLGTYNGLARFDGVSFATFDNINTPELRTTPIDAMHSDRQGRLWSITRGGHAAGYDAGRFFHCRPGPAQSRFIDNPFDNVPDRIREKGNHKPDAGHAPVLHFPVASVMRLGRITVRRTISMGESRCCDIGWGRRDPGV